MKPTMHSSQNEIYRNALKMSMKTSVWILKIILPVSLLVSLLEYFGVIDWLSVYLAPAFALIGLPGQASIVYLSSLFLPLYAPIAILSTMTWTLKESTILALMCLIAHNLPVETAIQKRTGTAIWKTLTIRIGFSIIGALLLNAVMPNNMEGSVTQAEQMERAATLGAVFAQWAIKSVWLCVKIILIITSLMMLQAVLKRYGMFSKIAQMLGPVLRFFGLPAHLSFLWLTAQTVGLAYGSGIMLSETQEQKLPKWEIDLFNYHIAVNHSLLEDTLIFVMIGIPAFWIIWPRLLFAWLLVWGVRCIRSYRVVKPIKSV